MGTGMNKNTKRMLTLNKIINENSMVNEARTYWDEEALEDWIDDLNELLANGEEGFIEYGGEYGIDEKTYREIQKGFKELGKATATLTRVFFKEIK